MTITQTWLVTGAHRGIGLGIVQHLLRSPHNVVFATCRRPPSAIALNALEFAPETLGKLYVVKMNATEQASIYRAMDEVKYILGDAGLDYLINNAAIGFTDDTPSNLDPEQLTATITANVAGPTLVTRIFIPLIERGNRKVIVNRSTSFASIGLDYGGQHASYSISKAALNMLTYKQAKERPDLIPFLVDPDMGGDNDIAISELQESAAGLVNVASNADQSYAGCLVNYKGETMPW